MKGFGRLWVVAVVALLGSVSVALAGELQMLARMDLDSVTNAVELKDVKGGPGVQPVMATWMKGKEKTRCVLTVPVAKEWKQLWIEFVPGQSGEVSLILFGGWVPDDKERAQIQVWVDDVEVKGAEVKNGSFEELKKDGAPANWTPVDKLGFKTVSSDGGQARTGKCCVMVSYTQTISQPIAVEAGKPCRISAWFKSAAK